MKKLFKTFFITTIIFFSIIFAAKASIISDEIQNSLLINNKEKIDLIIDKCNVIMQNHIDYYTAYYNFLGRDQYYIDHMIDEANYKFPPIPESGFAYHLLELDKYGYQYAQNHCFDDLINDNKIWFVQRIDVEDAHFKDLNTDVVEMNSTLNGLIRYSPRDREFYDFLSDTDNIEKIVAESVDEEITDCKIIYLTAGVFMLYLKGEETDYGMKFYHGERFQDYEQSFELYKVYKLSDLLENFANTDYCKQPEMMEEKPMYTAEAEALNSAGILQGTENGLELLKPLNRIEATTILVRILGLENNQTSDTSYFNDIPNDNWGVKYANIAYDAGITKGVENGNFAPNDIITSSQFATLLLRSSGETDVDWQTAVNIFVERGIITQEQADKMDLFTRGDMAKIIYECRERGMLD